MTKAEEKMKCNDCGHVDHLFHRIAIIKGRELKALTNADGDLISWIDITFDDETEPEHVGFILCRECNSDELTNIEL